MSNSVDVYIGKRLQEIRTVSGVEPSTLSDALSVSLQEYEKMEKGVRRLSATDLFVLAKILSVGVGAFFGGLISRLRDKA